MGASWLVKTYPDMPVIRQRGSIEHRTDELCGQYHDIDFLSFKGVSIDLDGTRMKVCWSALPDLNRSRMLVER